MIHLIKSCDPVIVRSRCLISDSRWMGKVINRSYLDYLNVHIGLHAAGGITRRNGVKHTHPSAKFKGSVRAQTKCHGIEQTASTHMVS